MAGARSAAKANKKSWRKPPCPPPRAASSLRRLGIRARALGCRLRRPRRARRDGARTTSSISSIKGGEVLDPSQNLRGQARHRHPLRADRGARGRHSRRQGASGCSTPAGKLVTPGLIDLHAHVFPYGSAIGIPADELVPFQGTTTLVSAGDAGANNIAAFRRAIVGQTRARLYAFVHIANIGLAGFPVPELYNIDYRADRCRRQGGGRERRPRARRQGAHERERHRQARPGAAEARHPACEIAGGGAKVMCHIGGVETPRADVADPRSAAPRRRAHALPIRARPTSPASSPTSCRTASCCPRRSPPSSAAWCSTSATAAAASTTRWPKRRWRPAPAPTPSPPTSTCSPATRRACPI